MGRGLCVSGDLNQVTSGGVFNTFWEMSPATFGVLHREHGDFGVSPWSFTQVLEMIFPREIPSFLRKHHLSMDIRTLRLIWRRIEAPV